ncbi:type II toxin-antitoxin system RelE/ParE family toxin [Candidatus Kaiserbacteria bacterium]|nr:type II toxin-antitoxin system RelE/ParE family toxin [Candidatus Kaiserbacteria bacterium]
MKLQFRERARADIRDIHTHLLQWSPEGAANVSRDIYAACRLIAEHPFGAPETSDPYVRVKHLVRFPYSIFYGIGKNTVEILHVRHTSRRPWI